MGVLIFGHKNPDTDTICSSIAYSYLKNKLGIEAKAVRLGDINEETKYVLNYFNIDLPELVKDVSGQSIILVDHNERTQTADGFEEAKVLELIDHHRISNFNVGDPLYARLEPVGCTATILLKLFKENGVTPPKEIAGLMLSAIISDTLLLKSPTCTKLDVEAANELSKLAEVNLEEYGLEMLKAGTSLGDKTDNELLNMDMKIFEMGNYKVGIGQVNTVNESELLVKKDSLLEEMKKINQKEGLELFLFVITNILTNDSIGLVNGGSLDILERAFNSPIINNEILLKNIVSRKKQVVPPLTEEFKK